MAENASPQRSPQKHVTTEKTAQSRQDLDALFASANTDKAPKVASRPKQADDLEDMWDNVPI